MSLLRVTPANLAAQVTTLQRRAFCHFNDATQRTRQMPTPETGAVSVIGTTFETWNGTAWVPLSAAPTPPYVPPAVLRWRATRAAASIPTGDSSHGGTMTTVENLGGWSGTGFSPSNPLLAPEAGSYTVSLFYLGAAFSGTAQSAALITMGGNLHAVPMQQATTNPIGGSVTAYIAAASQIMFSIRNSSGATVTNVQMRAEVVRVST